jgi:DNA polymerase-3 subunit beta
MDVTVERAVLAELAEMAASVAPTGAAAAVATLEHTLVQVVDGFLAIAATNLETTVLGRVPCQSVEAEGEMLPQAKAFSQVVKGLTGDDVRLRSAKGRLVVDSGGSTYRLQSADPLGFPTLPERGEEVAAIPDRALRSAFSRSIPVASNTKGAHNIQCVEVHPDEGKLRVLATDGHRVMVAEEWDRRIKASSDVWLIPVGGIKAIMGLPDGHLGITKVSRSGDGMWVFSTHRVDLFVRRSEVTFPNVTEAIPRDEPAVSVTLPQEALGKALKRLGLLSEGRVSTVRLSVRDSALTAALGNEDLGSGRERVACESKAGDGATLLAYQYATECVSALSDFINIDVLWKDNWVIVRPSNRASSRCLFGIAARHDKQLEGETDAD